MKIYRIVDSEKNETGDNLPDKFTATLETAGDYFRDNISTGYVEELTIESPVTKDVVINILNGDENYIQKRYQIGYKHKAN